MNTQQLYDVAERTGAKLHAAYLGLTIETRAGFLFVGTVPIAEYEIGETCFVVYPWHIRKQRTSPLGQRRRPVHAPQYVSSLYWFAAAWIADSCLIDDVYFSVTHDLQRDPFDENV